MLEAEDILNGLIRGALGGRGKSWTRAGRAVRGSGLIDAQTLLAAAGVAWGLYETWQQQQPAQGSPPMPATRVPQATPPPLPGASLTTPQSANGAPEEPTTGLPPELLRLLRLMISAARADGDIGEAESARILGEAREVGAEEDVRRELSCPRPVAEVVAGVDDPELKAQLYTLAYTIVRADEAVTGGERIYLAQLAHRLALEPDLVGRLEAEAAKRIDTAAATDGPLTR